ncbi:MAG: class I tRNA ligase family protein, partial [Acidimicrobiia bacterium]
MKGQLHRLGISYAWEREIATCHPEYYRWNQWLFLKMYERGLAYRRKSPVNWCPSCATVLANEQVVDGGCWRCGTPVTLRDLEQWFFRITAYADELLAATERLQQWPDRVLLMQRNWIGRSEGARVRFPILDRSGEPGSQQLEVFTTRIDTIFGATFLLLAPEHEQVDRFAADSADPAGFRAQLNRLRAQDRVARLSGAIEKEGFFTGRFARNPFTGEQVPIWIANFVIGGYGTGAVMGVPAHDERDFEFAKKYGLPIKTVIRPAEALREEEPAEVNMAYGILVDSGQFSGLTSEEALGVIAEHARSRQIGEPTVHFRLNDWGISRQRYWGTPIPIVYCAACGVVPVP